MKPTVVRTGGMLFLAGMLAVHGMLLWKLQDYIAKGYADFTIFYAAGKIIAAGSGADLYNGALQFEVQRGFAPNVPIRQAALPYNHPPFEAALFVPFTWIGYLHAYFLWNALNLSVLGVIVFLLRRNLAILRILPLWVWCLCSLAFFPVFVALMQGQDSILFLLILVFAYLALKRNADFTAGCCLALGLFRFHLVLPLVLLLVLGGKKTVLWGFLVIALLLSAISIGLVGWQAFMNYPQYVLNLETHGAGGAIVPANMPTIHGLIDPLFGNQQSSEWASIVVVGILSLALLLWVVLFLRKHNHGSISDLQFALMAVVTILVSYHAYAHDLSLLLLPLLLVANHLRPNFFEPAKISLFGPMLILCLSPLYLVLWFRYGHLNLLALALVWWVWGISREISQDASIASMAPNGSELHGTP